jgi:hypothetical protein
VNVTTLTHWAGTAPVWQPVAAGVVALLAVLVVWRMVLNSIRALRHFDLADVITVLIAMATTVYAGAGNWKFLGSAMHYGPDLRAVLVCALEGAVVVEGLRSRKNIAEVGKAGADGVGLWVLAALSSVLAASASGSLQEALGRLAIPLVAAWLWERLLAPQRRARKALRQASPIRWRITPERILVWLRLADSTDMDVSKVDAGRRVARFLRKTDRERNGWRNPFTAKASADRERLRMFRDALMRYGDPTEVYGTLATVGYEQALTRMELAAQASHAGESDVSHGGGSKVSQQHDLITPGDSVFADVIASLPSRPPLESANGRKRASAASQKPRRRESVTARVSVDVERAAQVYRASVEAGEPLSSRDLAALTKVSQSTASRAIRAATGG